MRRIVLVLFVIWGVWGQALADTYRFSSPPRLGPAESQALFAPLMEFLSRGTGEKFVYVDPGSWFSYQDGIRKGRFDLLLDDAHLAAWRIALRGDVPLVTARNRVRFVLVAVRNSRIYSKDDLIGQPVCAYPPPDLGTVSFLRKFAGPFQVPTIVATPGSIERVQRLLAGDCVGALVSRHFYSESEALRPVAHQLEIITQTRSFPGPTLTASKGVPAGLRNALRRLLLSTAAERATSELRSSLMEGDRLMTARKEDYAGLDNLLRSYPGFAE